MRARLQEKYPSLHETAPPVRARVRARARAQLRARVRALAWVRARARAVVSARSLPRISISTFPVSGAAAAAAELSLLTPCEL